MPEETKIAKTNIKELFEKAGLVYKEKDGRQIAIIGGKEVDILFGEDGVASTEDGQLTKVIMDHLRKLDSVFSGEKGTSVGKRLLKRCSDTEIKKARTIIDAIIEEREERGKRDKEVNDKEAEIVRLTDISDKMKAERVRSEEEISVRKENLRIRIDELRGGGKGGKKPSKKED